MKAQRLLFATAALSAALTVIEFLGVLVCAYWLAVTSSSTAGNLLFANIVFTVVFGFCTAFALAALESSKETERRRDRRGY